MNKKGIGYKILYSPLVKILLGIIVVTSTYGLSQYLTFLFLKTFFLNLSGDIGNLVVSIVSATFALVSYSLLYQYYEKREVSELSTNRFAYNLLLGILIGMILQSLTILLIFLQGGYEVISVNKFIYIVPALAIAFTSAIFEEILFRGIIHRIIEEKLGSYIALIVSALIFGALHFSNPNSSIVTSIGLAIQAGVLLGVCYTYSKSLWLPISLHFTWNFVQSGIYGATVSGHRVEKSLINSRISGADWFTGGEFGPEGSIQATVFCLIAAIILLYMSHKENKITSPRFAGKNNSSLSLQA